MSYNRFKKYIKKAQEIAQKVQLHTLILESELQISIFMMIIQIKKLEV